MTDLLEDVNLSELTFVPVVCESTLHAEWKLPPHEAVWWACAPCLSLIAVCEDRRRKCFRDGSWQCAVKAHGGCTAVHAYDQIEWTRVHNR